MSLELDAETLQALGYGPLLERQTFRLAVRYKVRMVQQARLHKERRGVQRRGDYRSTKPQTQATKDKRAATRAANKAKRRA